MNRDRRRSSIHDITSVTAGDVAAAGAPITGGPAAAGAMPMGPAGHEAPPPGSADGHVRARAHGPPSRGAHGGAGGRGHARHVPARSSLALCRASGIPGATGQDAPMIDRLRAAFAHLQSCISLLVLS
uniref:ScMYB76 protein n=1 Tax=Saccharum hybrid cultivar Co 86032 TaxID=672234 RepID=A0A0C6WCS5_9POAL|nr:ScMYB76 protein [Saccharum hybrid cultivar Co 86032]